MKNLKVLIVDEKTIFQSIISDCVMFCFILGSFWVNYNYLGGSWILQLFIVFLFSVAVIHRSSKVVKKVAPSETYRKEEL